MNIPKDQSWAWKSVFGGFISHIMTMSINLSYSIIFKDIQTFYGLNSAVVSTVYGLFMGIKLLLSPVTVVFTNLFGGENVAITGGVLISGGLLIASCSLNFFVFMISFGILVGIGLSFIVTSTQIIISENFNKRKSLAFGLSSAGVSVGYIIFPHIFAIAVIEYGFRSALMLLSACASNAIVIGLLHRRPQSIKDAIIKVESNPILDQKTNNRNEIKYSPNYLNKIKNSFFNAAPLRNLNFMIYCIGALGFFIGMVPWSIFIVDFIRSIGDISLNIAVLSFTLEGICQVASRVLSGVVFDIRCFRRFRGISCSIFCFISGISCVFLVICEPSVNSYLLISMLRGFSVGVFVAQNIVILGDLCDPNLVSMSIGILTFMKGVGSILGSAFSGVIRDHYQSYFATFMFLAINQFLAAALILFANVRSLMNESLTNRSI